MPLELDHRKRHLLKQQLHCSRRLRVGLQQRRAIWPLHDIAITNIVWRIAYKKGVGGVLYCTTVVQ